MLHAYYAGRQCICVGIFAAVEKQHISCGHETISCSLSFLSHSSWYIIIQLLFAYVHCTWRIEPGAYFEFRILMYSGVIKETIVKIIKMLSIENDMKESVATLVSTHAWRRHSFQNNSNNRFKTFGCFSVKYLFPGALYLNQTHPIEAHLTPPRCQHARTPAQLFRKWGMRIREILIGRRVWVVQTQQSNTIILCPISSEVALSHDMMSAMY